MSNPVKSRAAAQPRFDPSNPFSYRLEGTPNQGWTEVPLSSVRSMKDQTPAKHSTQDNSMQDHTPPLFQIDDDLSAYSTRHVSAATSSTPSLTPSRNTSNRPSPRNNPTENWIHYAAVGAATQPLKSARPANDHYTSKWNVEHVSLNGPTAVTEYTRPEFIIRFV